MFFKVKSNDLQSIYKRRNQRYPSKNCKTLRDFVLTINHKDIYDLPAFYNSIDYQYQKLTFGETRLIIEEIASVLLNLGIKKGDRIGLLSENRTEWALSYLSIVSIGAIVVPLDILLNKDEIKPLINDSELRFIFVSGKEKKKIDEILNETPSIEKIIVFDEVTETEEIIEKKQMQAMYEKLSKMKILPDNIKEFLNRNKEKLILTNAETKKVLFDQNKYIDFNSLVEAGYNLRLNGDTNFEKVSVDPEDIAAIIYTSGTTGNPKGVMLTHKNLATCTDEIQMGERFNHHDRFILVLPLHHTYPTTAGMLLPFLTRASIKFVSSLRPDVIIKAFKDYKATIVPIVPLFLEKMYKNVWQNIKDKSKVLYIIMKALFSFTQIVRRFTGNFIHPGYLFFSFIKDKLGLSHLRFFVSGGGPISREVLKGFYNMGVFIVQGYGLTETSPTVTSNSSKFNKFGSVGFPLKSVEIKIDNPDKRGNGEILLKTPYLMKGYYKRPDLTKEVIDENGYFHTGDIGRLDLEGYLWITGRLKNIIITAGGKNVYPEELEEILSKSPYITELVVVGNKDIESNSETPYAVIYPNFDEIQKLIPDKQIKEEFLYDLIGKEIKRLTENLAPYKKISGFEIIYEELPKTSKKSIKRFLFKKKQ